MKISLKWLSEWVDVGSDVPALAHTLTMAGLEVEGIERAAPALPGIVVGEVLAVEKHPNAEKLSICRVAGGPTELQIVCGAPNVRAGLKVPLALIGAKLPGGLEINAAKLRGVESSGMLCSAKELGLEDGSSGLLELPAELRTGEDFTAALQLDDQIFEVNLTPNRGDCMSVLGIAREVAAAREVSWSVPFNSHAPASLDDRFPIRLQASAACPKFVGRVIRDVNSAARSPLWIRERLRRAGIRPISAVVDITNYVLLELGQPMHAYDLSKVHGSIDVRLANEGEEVALLDGRTIALKPDVLVIADEQRVLGLAGIMGGATSGISDATTDVFLEVAYFNPDSIAGRGRRYGLVTDASQRFERGVDPQLQERASERATQLILEIAGGSAGPMGVTAEPSHLPTRSVINLRRKRVDRLLGIAPGAQRIASLLKRLGIEARAHDDEWSATPPSWRFDLQIEEDLIEEIARLYGFDRIPEINATSEQRIAALTETRVSKERAAQLLVDRGYCEAITYSFTDPALQTILFPHEPGLALANPISGELAVMRVSLWPGLIQALRDNQRRQQERVRLFEFGRKFAAGSGSETEMIAGLAGGLLLPEQWGSTKTSVDFFDVRGDIEALLALTGTLDEFEFRPDTHPALHPAQCARIYRGAQAIGWLGTLHPEVVTQLDLTYPAVLFELEASSTLQSALPQFQEISRYPAIRRDLALIVGESIDLAQIRSVVAEHAGRLLQALSVFDVYRGAGIEKGKKSIALGFTLQDTSRTLTDEDADAILNRVADRLRTELDATIRDK